MKSQACARKLRLEVLDEEMGGWQDIDLKKGFLIIRKYDEINFICEIGNSVDTQKMLDLIPFIDEKMDVLRKNLI